MSNDETQQSPAIDSRALLIAFICVLPICCECLPRDVPSEICFVCCEGRLMIVQTAAPGAPHFIIRQQDHAAVSGVFAAHFGNEQFKPLDPAEPLIYVAAHHDDGWAEIDAAPTFDPQTRLPHHLPQTPTARLIRTGKRSPDANEQHHPLSGLLSSMHTCGIYNGRYGLSDRKYIDMIDPHLRGEAEAMLQAERTRQARLKQQLRDRGQAALVADDVLFHNYRLLQFFDMLALHIQTWHREAFDEAQFKRVPRALGDEVTITARQPEPGQITLHPWPFAVPTFSVTTSGRYMAPLPIGDDPDDLGALFYALPITQQTYTLAARD